MPNYVFSKVGSPKQIVEKFYHMSEAPSIGSVVIDSDGTQWKRVATKPRASCDTVLDPFSAADFVRATNRKDTIGSLWDRSEEMSRKREEKTGEPDGVKQKFYDNYARKHKNRRHPQEMKEVGTRKLKQKGISISWGDD